MTASPVRLLPVRPGMVRNAMLNAMARHGIEPATAESIYADLTTGCDPRPDELPAHLSYRGINVVWPLGRHTRELRPDELRSLNCALRAAGVKRENMLDPEDTAEVGRHAFRHLWVSLHSDSYNPEPVREAQMRQLVAEATAVRHAQPLNLVFEDKREPQPVVLTHGQDLDNALCWATSPKGIHCDQDNHHDGKHKNGRTTWAEKAAKVTVQHVSTDERVITAQPTGSLIDPDELAELVAALEAIENRSNA